MEIAYIELIAGGPVVLTMDTSIQQGDPEVGLLRGIFWITAAAATGGLALALLPNDWDGIDGCCDDE